MSNFTQYFLYICLLIEDKDDSMIRKQQYDLLKSRINEPRKFIQLLVGARQVGKTTLINQLLADITIPHEFFSADSIDVSLNTWIINCWDTVRTKMALTNQTEYLLVFDEIQKLNNWSEIVKKEWDADTRNNVNLKVILLGSSRILTKKGLTESLAGRFELIRMPHWSFSEMQEAFGFGLDEYLYFGGYPGAAGLINDENRWQAYIKDSIIETTISKDILMLTQVNKPALLRQLFELGTLYSGQILSFTKILGQLHDAGNTTTLAGYLRLLEECSMLKGIEKFAGDVVRKRGSIPKFQVYNTALMNALTETSFKEVRLDPKAWGRITESAIGAHLINASETGNFNVFYWRNNNDEVDFVLQKKQQTIAIEVKSGKQTRNNGLSVFRQLFKPKLAIMVGSEGISTEEFLKINPEQMF